MAEIKKVSWNASEGLIMELSNRRSYANTFFVNGDIKKALATLISIKQSVVQSFNADERIKLDNLEQRFNNVSKYLSANSAKSFNTNLREAYFIARDHAVKIYSEYNNCLMDLLEQYGYLIGESTDASKMKF